MGFKFTRPLGFHPGIRRPDEEVFDIPLGAAGQTPRRFRAVDHYPQSFQKAVEDQRQTSSCVGNAVVSLYEFLWHRTTGKWANFSRMMAYYWARKVRGWENRDAGSIIGDCMREVTSKGLCLESFWRFREELLYTQPNRKATKQASRHKALRPLRVPRQQIWEIISGGGDPAAARPVVIGFTVYQQRVFSRQVAGGDGIIHVPRSGDDFGGGHAVLVSGYDLDEGWAEGPNSWSTNWGPNSPTGRPGWFRLDKRYIEDPQLSSDFWTFDDVEVGEAA